MFYKHRKQMFANKFFLEKYSTCITKCYSFGVVSISWTGGSRLSLYHYGSSQDRLQRKISVKHEEMGEGSTSGSGFSQSPVQNFPEILV